MSKKAKKEKKHKKWLKSCEHKSDKRTADFLAKQFGQLQEQLYDLMADMRTFDHYSEIEDAGRCLMIIQRLKHKYEKFEEKGFWSDNEHY